MIMEAFNRSDKTRLFSPSKGNQTKYHIGDIWVKEDYLGYEAASEYLCSRILTHASDANDMPLDYVIYDMERGRSNEQDVMYCTSKHFLKDGEQLHTLHDVWEKLERIPFYKKMERLSTIERIQTTVDFIHTNLGIQNAGEQLTLLLEFDAFVLNEDRHSNNIAFVEDADGNFRFSPIFDNGAAFLSDTTNYSMMKSPHRLINEIKAKPFNVKFDKQVEAAESLFGVQLYMDLPDFSEEFSQIEQFYGIQIANRMKAVYQTQKEKYFSSEKEYEIELD